MKKLAAILLACSIAPLAALAAQDQAAQSAAPGVAISPDRPKSSQSAGQADQDATLAQKLSRTNGTIKPPAVDPGMTKAPPPDTRGTMPILRPPATTQSK